MSREAVENLIDRWLIDKTFREEMRKNPEAAVHATGENLEKAEWAALRKMGWGLSREELKARANEGWGDGV